MVHYFKGELKSFTLIYVDGIDIKKPNVFFLCRNVLTEVRTTTEWSCWKSQPEMQRCGRGRRKRRTRTQDLQVCVCVLTLCVEHFSCIKRVIEWNVNYFLSLWCCWNSCHFLKIFSFNEQYAWKSCLKTNLSFLPSYLYLIIFFYLPPYV